MMVDLGVVLGLGRGRWIVSLVVVIVEQITVEPSVGWDLPRECNESRGM